MKAVEELSFEEALAEMQEAVAKLEAGEATLEESLAIYERGQALGARCIALLDQAMLKVKQLTADGQEILFEDA